MDLEDMVLNLGGTEIRIYGLHQPQRNHIIEVPQEVVCETSYDIANLDSYVEENEGKLLQDQRQANDTITDAVRNHKVVIFFLDAPGGTGKTFVTTLLLAKVRQQRLIVIEVASSEIAAALLPGGHTAHSSFKLPLNLATKDRPMCNISKGTGTSQVLQNCQLIIWDECTMSHKAAFEAVD